jgi:hypothetical protein
MLENCLSGSEGGGALLSLPLSLLCLASSEAFVPLVWCVKLKIPLILLRGRINILPHLSDPGL